MAPDREPTNSELMTELRREHEPSNSDIMRELGAITENLRGVRRELDSAAEGRRLMYERMDNNEKQVANLGYAIDTQAQISAQTRDVLKELTRLQRELANDVKPLLELKGDLPMVVGGYKGTAKAARFVGWALTISGGSLIALLVVLGESLRRAILHWLGLPPGPPTP